jgi:hypothetical protein
MKNRKIAGISLLLVVIIVIGYARITFADAGIWDSSQLSAEILENRNGNLIIERVVGIVLNDAGDGKVLNTDDPYYNYISYRCIGNFRTGDIVVTYLYYNPETGYIDDVIYRSDWTVCNVYSIDQQEIDMNFLRIFGEYEYE